MSFVVILGIAVALAMDCFAITLGLACGSRGLTIKQAVRMAAAFGGFQLVMPVLGWLAGDRLLGLIKSFDHWVAFGLLALIGGRMIYESFEMSEEEKACRPDKTQGTRLLILALATSIDALAVGVTLPMLNAPFVLSLATIGVTTAALSVAGLFAGRRFGAVLGKRLDVVGGVVLIALGTKILIEHLTAA